MAALSNPVLATLIFVCSEVMFFAALISSFLIIKAGSGVVFVPPAQVKLPVIATGLNTAVLFLSGYLLHLAVVKFGRSEERERALRFFAMAIFCGAVFVCCQGYEWIKLLSYGMSMTSGIFAACFFLLIGSHGLHAAATVIIMFYFYIKREHLRLDNLKALRIFWFFVVGVWPLLYGLVYF